MHVQQRVKENLKYRGESDFKDRNISSCRDLMKNQNNVTRKVAI